METRRQYFRILLVIVAVAGMYFAMAAANRPPAPRGLTAADHPTMAASRAYLSAMGPAAAPRNSQTIGPRAQATEREFDLGAVDPFRLHQHVFSIKNTGDTPLTLLKQSATSQDVTVDIDPHTVAPGRTAKVTMIWEATSNNQALDARTTLVTNDPAAATLEFALFGRTRILLAAEPPMLSAPRISNSEPTTLTTRIVSLEWDAFSLDVRPSLSDIQWELAPLDAGELAKLKVKSGWQLSVTLPPGLPSGPVNERVQLTARPMSAAPPISANGEGQQHEADEIVREIPIQGAVASRLVVFGHDLTTLGAIDVGRLDPADGYNGVFTLRVNDAEPQLAIAEVIADPPYIEASLEPMPGVDVPGLYRLRVRIPPQSTAASHMGEKRGRLRISFDHPRIENLDLGVEFFVPTAFFTTRVERTE